MGKTYMTMLLALMLLANGVMATEMMAKQQLKLRRESLTSSLATNLFADVAEVTTAASVTQPLLQALFVRLGIGVCRTANNTPGTMAPGTPLFNVPSIQDCIAECAARSNCYAIEYRKDGTCEIHAEPIDHTVVTQYSATRQVECWTKQAVSIGVNVSSTREVGKKFLCAAEAWKAEFSATPSSEPHMEYIRLERNGVQVWAGFVEAWSHDETGQVGQFVAGRRHPNSTLGFFQVGDVVRRAEASDELEDAFKETLALEIEYTDAATHCTRTKLCELQLVPQSYTLSEKCQCVAAYWNEGLDTGSLDCTAWATCMKEHEGVIFTEIFRLAAKAKPLQVSDPSSSLSQQKAGHRQLADLSGCTDPFTAPKCNCFAEIFHNCSTVRGIKKQGALTDCLMEHLCKNELVCSSWKTRQCVGFDTSLLAVDDTEAAVKACSGPSATEAAWRTWSSHSCEDVQQGWAVCTTASDSNHATVMFNCPATCAKARGECSEADMSHTAGAMRERRQPLGNNSSSEPMALLDKSVSGKSCSRSAR